jgi:hypothetical protein
MEKGAAAQAIPPLEEGARQLREAGYTAVTCWFLGWLADAYRLAGQGERARRTAGEILALAPVFGGTWSAAYARRVLGRLAFEAGNLAEAANALDEARRGFQDVHSPFEAGRTHLDLAAVARGRDDNSAAGTHVQAALALFRPLGVPKYVALAEHLAVELPAKPPRPDGSIR